MNKILIDKEVTLQLKNDLYYLEISKDTKIKINSLENINTTLDILIKDSTCILDLELAKFSNLKINVLGIDSRLDINLNCLEYSKLELFDSILTSVDSINNININCQKNSNIKLYTNGINLENSKCYFTLNGIIKKEASDVNLLESSKIINIKNGDSKIIPNLIVDNMDVLASHSAYIGEFDKESISYLKSRGLKINDIYRLLTKAFLLSNTCNTKDRFSFEILKKIN